MPPKKASPAKKATTSKKNASHPTYKEMITEAIVSLVSIRVLLDGGGDSSTFKTPKSSDHLFSIIPLPLKQKQQKERSGSSRQAIKKYIHLNFKGLSETADSLINQALKKGVEAGEFLQPKGASGPVKIVKKDSESSKKPAPKKEAAPKKATPVAKKAAPKKAAAPKKTASASTKAATAKPTPRPPPKVRTTEGTTKVTKKKAPAKKK
ncbi:hypothetical protein HDU97_000746 [Phlyctochytrium planicorne]|nr:hypothetical protein HDU97_000746 [Phlyctochytrium planicorne]